MTRIPLLDVLDADDRAHVLDVAVGHTYGRGDALVREGEPSHTLHLIRTGRVAVRVGTPEGDVATLAVLGPGDCFGELTLTERASVRTATVEALEDVTTLAIARADFEDLRSRRPSVDRFIVAVLGAQVKRLSAMVVDGLYVPAEARLAHRLGDLVRVYDEGVRPIEIRVPQSELATMAGTTRPTANQFLKRLEADGVLAVARGRLIVHRPEAIEEGSGWGAVP